jgi:hypothetical protein
LERSSASSSDEDGEEGLSARRFLDFGPGRLRTAVGSFEGAVVFVPPAVKSVEAGFGGPTPAGGFFGDSSSEDEDDSGL